MHAILIKNGPWVYISSSILKSDIKGDVKATAIAVAAQKCIEPDLKVQSDIVLSMNRSEIKQLKGCRRTWSG